LSAKKVKQQGKVGKVLANEEAEETPESLDGNLNPNLPSPLIKLHAISGQ